MTEMDEIIGSAETVQRTEREMVTDENAASLNVTPKSVEFERQAIAVNENAIATGTTAHARTISSTYLIGEEIMSQSPPIKNNNNNNDNSHSIARKVNETKSNVFDDIEYADDVKMCCIEKKEPNGNLYFIEMDLTESTDSDETMGSLVEGRPAGEDIIIQRMVEKVLFQADTPQRPDSDMVEQPPQEDVISEDESVTEDAAVETRAIVHTVAVSSESDAVSEHTATVDDNGKKHIFPFEIHSSPSDTQIQQSSSQSVGHSEEFKQRLTRFLAQFGNEPTKVDLASLGRKRSISIPDNMNAVSMTIAPEHSGNDANANGRIPRAPKFDQTIYSTIGSRMKVRSNQMPAPATAISVDNEFEISFQREALSSGHMHRTKRSDDLIKLFDQPNEQKDNETIASVSSIREKLNEIYGRARPPIVIFAKEHPPNDTDDNRSAEDAIHLRLPDKPYDTVQRQKLLFSDVLRSINPEIRNSLQRSDSFGSIDV